MTLLRKPTTATLTLLRVVVSACLLTALASPALARNEQEELDDCIAVRRILHKKIELLKERHIEYDEWQATFNKFYAESQVAMEVVYPSLSWRMAIPLIADIEIPKPATITGGVQYTPKVRLTGATSRRNSVISVLSDLETLAGKFGVGDVVGQALSLFKTAFTNVTDVLVDYDYGIETHQEFTESRKRMLGNYSQVLTAHYCEQILPLEEDILSIRDNLHTTDCGHLGEQVLITDVRRSNWILNDVHLERAKEYCAASGLADEMTEEAERAAGVLAGVICIMGDPSFWDDFFEDMYEDDAEAAKAAEEADKSRMQRFYASYGFQSEEAAFIAVSKSAKDTDWQDLVVKNVQSRCGSVVSDESKIRQVIQLYASQ